MKKSIEVLNYIYQNAKRGVDTTNEILNITQLSEFKKLLSEICEEYERTCNDAIKLFIKFGTEEKDISKLNSITSYIKVKVTKKDDISTFAKILIEKANKGIIEITKVLNEGHNIDSDIEKLAEKLISSENSNIEDLKAYL